MKRLVIIAAASIAAGLSVFLPACEAARADQLVSFESLASRRFQTRFARERGDNAPLIPATRIQGYLSRPEGAGPFPAIVLLHPCTGLSDAQRQAAATMSGWGYVTLAVDDFTTRGVNQTCTQSSFTETIQDALGGLRFLAEQSFVDPKRLAVVGFAQGGTTALNLALNRLPPLEDAPVPPQPRAVVSFYPWCADARGRLATATLIIAGARDDWNPAVYCEQWVQRHTGDGAELKFVAYAGAHHAFDDAAMGAGRNVFGHGLQYDSAAAAQAMAEMRAFLAKQLGAN